MTATSRPTVIRFRVGINVSDVISEGNLHGEGVNIAARPEALSPVGGICVSRTVVEHVQSRLNLPFEPLGPLMLKNIAHPVEAFVLRLEPACEASRPVRVYTLRPEGTAGVRTPSASATVSGSPPVAAPRLSIVVLPFTSLGDDQEQQYFADGITEDLTTDLSRISGMFVISRNTAFTYRSKPTETKQIGRELGVRYVLEGGGRRSDYQLRVNAHLDAATDVHLWTERFDHDTGDLFALENEITSCLANALGVELIAAEAARPAEHPDTLDYILRGRAAGLKPYSRENLAEQTSLFERALALDPQSVEAQMHLADALVRRVLSGTTGETTGDLIRAEGLVCQALAAKPRSAYGHFVKGFGPERPGPLAGSRT